MDVPTRAARDLVDLLTGLGMATDEILEATQDLEVHAFVKKAMNAEPDRTKVTLFVTSEYEIDLGVVDPPTSRAGLLKLAEQALEQANETDRDGWIVGEEFLLGETVAERADDDVE